MKQSEKNHLRAHLANHNRTGQKHWAHKAGKKEVKIVRTTIILLVVIVLAVMGVRMLTSSQALAFTTETAKTATSFIDSEGVQVHSTYGAYSNASAVVSHVKQLGIRWVRDGAGGGGIQSSLYAAGIKLDLVTTVASTSAMSGAHANASAHAGSVVAVEGLNEVDMFHGSDFSGACSLQANLYNQMKSDPATKNIPVMSFSIAGINLGSTDVAAQKGCPNLANISDIANIHSYLGARTPEIALPARYASAVKYLGGSKNPVAITETGNHTALQNTLSNPPIDEAGQAVYAPRLYLFNFLYGVKMTSKYELVDQGNDQTNQEKTFGFFHNNWTPKPAATAIANMNSILSDSKSFTPGGLAYTFSSGADSTLQHLLLQKADGSFYLAVWRNTSVWDRTSKTDLNPGSSNLTINFPNSVPITTYEPNVSSNPTQATVTATSKTISLGPNVVILRIGGGSVPPPPPPPSTKPDLTVTTASPVTAVAGSSVTYMASVKNQGGVAIAAGTPITAEFSLGGKVIGTSTAYTNGLAAGEAATVTLSAPVTVPAAGNYPLIVTVDKTNTISESDETNNTYSVTFASTTTLPPTGKPDLTVTLVKPSQADNGTPVVFAAVVKNIGSVATPANTLIGVAFSVDGAHVSMSTYDTSSLAPGQSVTLSANTGPNSNRFWTSVAGTHQLSAWVDDQNRIAESNETNNTATITISVNN